MAYTHDQIVSEISAYMRNSPFKKAADWYVGIAADARARLFTDHSVNEHNGYWIFRKAFTADAARYVEKAYLDAGHDGGPGGGSDDTVFVYAYVKLPGTTR